MTYRKKANDFDMVDKIDNECTQKMFIPMAPEYQLEQLKKLREPFKPNQISKLPKPTLQQTNSVRQDYRNGIRCEVCGGWHHKDVIHLDYVGHAALTDRLLDVDPTWNWEPVTTDEKGGPLLDDNGGMWIRLTVCGVTRLGYGDAQGKTGGDAMKERIGDALRNAAMRFGAALDLWHKGDLHTEDVEEKPLKAAEKRIKIAEECQKAVEIAGRIKSLLDQPDTDEVIYNLYIENEEIKNEIWTLFNTAEKKQLREICSICTKGKNNVE